MTLLSIWSMSGLSHAAWVIQALLALFKRHYEFLPFNFIYYIHCQRCTALLMNMTFLLMMCVLMITYFAGTCLFNLVICPFLFVIRKPSWNLQKPAAASWEYTSHPFNQSIIFTCCSAWNVMSWRKYALTVPTFICFLVHIIKIISSPNVTP